jgi:hypothetical protein
MNIQGHGIQVRGLVKVRLLQVSERRRVVLPHTEGF